MMILSTSFNTGEEVPFFRGSLFWPDLWVFIGSRRTVSHRTRRDFLVTNAYFRALLLRKPVGLQSQHVLCSVFEGLDWIPGA